MKVNTDKILVLLLVLLFARSKRDTRREQEPRDKSQQPPTQHVLQGKKETNKIT